MPSFRSAAIQAKYLVIKKVAHGESRHLEKKGDVGKVITSIGTEVKYRGNIKRFLIWLHANKLDAASVTPDVAHKFLNFKSENSVQKTVDGYRQSIQIVFEIQLDYVVSQQVSFLVPRAYLDKQIQLLIRLATQSLGLSIRIAVYAGLRAIELDTISRSDEMREDDRAWLEERHFGKVNDIAYIVCGKGGLRRKIFLSVELAAELEKFRLEHPIEKRQREINYTKRYSIIGGHSFSLQFSRLSFEIFAWSTGAHGLRHRYAKDRITSLQISGFKYQDALKIVSQELGHFSTTNTLAYLR